MNTTSSHEEIIIKPERLTRIGLIFFPLISLFTIISFYLQKGWFGILAEWNFFSIWFLPIIVFGIIIHEGIHGLVCGIVAPSKFKAVKFGFSKAMLSPYMHCTETIKGWQYAFSLAAPGILLGVIPFLWALFSSQTGFLFGGIVFIWGAIGDFAILWAIRHQLKGTQIADHPELAGCIVYKER